MKQSCFHTFHNEENLKSREDYARIIRQAELSNKRRTKGKKQVNGKENQGDSDRESKRKKSSRKSGKSKNTKVRGRSPLVQRNLSLDLLNTSLTDGW